VSWLTDKSPVDLIEEQKDQSPQAADERRIIEALAEQYGQDEWTAKDAAKDIEVDVWASALRFKGERPSGSEVSYWLRHRKDRVFGRLILKNQLDRKGIAKWSLPGMPGIAGDNSTSRAKDGGEGGNTGSRKF
jgi:hypothetical protein